MRMSRFGTQLDAATDQRRRPGFTAPQLQFDPVYEMRHVP